MKKIKIILCLTLCLSLILSMTAFAITPGEEFSLDLFNLITSDYQKQTGLTKIEAKSIFDEIGIEGLSSEEINCITNVIPSGDEFEKLTYIQDNYKTLLDKLGNNNKEKLHKYFLYNALLLYKNNSFDRKNITNSNKSRLNSLLWVSEENLSYVAELNIFSDGRTNIEEGSSGLTLDTGIHAFITVRNISSNNITVGKLTVAPGKTISLGTWGSQSEHTGLWYNLEAYKVYNKFAYGSRVSLTTKLTSSNIDSLNQYIVVNGDKWSKMWNCSTFAVNCWNMFNVGTSKELSAGIINTPKNLADSIKLKSRYFYGSSVPYDYKVYYGNGLFGTPKRSLIY